MQSCPRLRISPVEPVSGRPASLAERQMTVFERKLAMNLRMATGLVSISPR